MSAHLHYWIRTTYFVFAFITYYNVMGHQYLWNSTAHPCNMCDQAGLLACHLVSLTELPWSLGAIHRQLHPFSRSFPMPFHRNSLSFCVRPACPLNCDSRTTIAAPPAAVNKSTACTAVQWEPVCHVMTGYHDFKSGGQLFGCGDHPARVQRIHLRWERTRNCMGMCCSLNVYRTRMQ